MAAILPPQLLIAKPPDSPPPLVVRDMHGSAAAREATTLPTGQAPYSTAHEAASGAVSLSRSSSGDPGHCSVPNIGHDGFDADGSSIQERCASTDAAGCEDAGMACDGEPPRDSITGAVLPRWDEQAAAGDDPAVTQLLTQRFMPHRQIAAIRANGTITIWREDGGCRFTLFGGAASEPRPHPALQHQLM